MDIRRTLALLATTAAATLTPVAAAQASTLSASVHGEQTGSHGETTAFQDVRFAAAPGERNDLTVRMEPGAVVVADAGGAPMTAGSGCTADNAVTVRCALDPLAVQTLWVDLGDGDDRFTVAPRTAGDTWIPPVVRGGDGNDVLDGSAAGFGSVSLDGGAGDDIALGGAGNDGFVGDPGHDTIAGGPGHDSLSYAARTDPIRASIGVQQPGDEDDVSGIESLTGGRGDDHLTGSEGDDEISGGYGADVIDGLGGDDRLSAYEGLELPEADVVRGGAGNDGITLGEGGRADGGPGADRIDGGTRARIAGGPGRDELTGGIVTADDDGSAGDFVSCGQFANQRPPARATLGVGDVSMWCGTRLRRTAGRPGLMAIDRFIPVDSTYDGTHLVAMAIWCADEAPHAGCPTRVELRDPAGRIVARRATTLRRGGGRRVAVHYGAAFHRRLLAARALPLTVVATARGAHGRVVTDRYNICLQSLPRSKDEQVACR